MGFLTNVANNTNSGSTPPVTEPNVPTPTGVGTSNWAKYKVPVIGGSFLLATGIVLVVFRKKIFKKR